jgi:hypothetical protein
VPLSISALLLSSLISLSSFADETLTAPTRIGDAALRAHATTYPSPQFPETSLRVNHTGRVVIEVVIAPRTRTSSLAIRRSSRVLEAPDKDMASAVLDALAQASYIPFFDDKGNALAISGHVVWEFRINAGTPEVIDVYAPPKRKDETASQLAIDDLHIVQRARQILSSEGTWNRHDNRQCPPAAKLVSLYCALEQASLQVTGTFEHRGAAMEATRSAMDEVAPHHPNYNHWLMDYNNDASTSFADIQNVLRVAEEQISKRIDH